MATDDTLFSQTPTPDFVDGELGHLYKKNDHLTFDIQIGDWGLGLDKKVGQKRPRFRFFAENKRVRPNKKS